MTWWCFQSWICHVYPWKLRTGSNLTNIWLIFLQIGLKLPQCYCVNSPKQSKPYVCWPIFGCSRFFLISGGLSSRLIRLGTHRVGILGWPCVFFFIELYIIHLYTFIYIYIHTHTPVVWHWYMQRHFLVHVFIIIIITKHKSCILRKWLSCMVMLNSTMCGLLLPCSIIIFHYSLSIILVFVCTLERDRYFTEKKTNGPLMVRG